MLTRPTRRGRRLLGWVALLTLAAIAGSSLPLHAGGPEPAPPASVAHLRSIDRSAARMLSALPAPHLPANAIAWRPVRQPQQLVDDFEDPQWPDPRTWIVVTDLNGAAGGQVQWAPRNCRAADGSRALWAVGGGTKGAALPCGADYPQLAASSALVWLDLTSLASVAELALVFDIWSDTAPTEGLFINYMTFDGLGRPTARRTVYSATGRTSAWTRGIRLDLTSLRDRFDPGWHFDARGRHVYLEFVFVSGSGTSGGEGIYLDNLSLELREPPPIIVPPTTPTPPPAVNRTVACSSGENCGTLAVRAFVDSRCDGRYQGGIDSKVRSQPRVDVVAGSELLGTRLSRTGYAYFRLPYAGGVRVSFQVPGGYEMCSNSPNPVNLAARDFGALGRTKVDFRIKVSR